MFSLQKLYSSRLDLLWVVAQDCGQPFLYLSLIHVLSLGVGLNLILADLVATEVVGVLVAEIKSANRGSWMHGKRLSQHRDI